jgi:hypothetical protein
MAIILLLSLDTATTDGSLMTTPAFFLYTNVLAVPKSMAISFASFPVSQKMTFKPLYLKVVVNIHNSLNSNII